MIIVCACAVYVSSKNVDDNPNSLHHVSERNVLTIIVYYNDDLSGDINIFTYTWIIIIIEIYTFRSALFRITQVLSTRHDF